MQCRVEYGQLSHMAVCTITTCKPIRDTYRHTQIYIHTYLHTYIHTYIHTCKLIFMSVTKRKDAMLALSCSIGWPFGRSLILRRRRSKNLGFSPLHATNLWTLNRTRFCLPASLKLGSQQQTYKRDIVSRPGFRLIWRRG